MKKRYWLSVWLLVVMVACGQPVSRTPQTAKPTPTPSSVNAPQVLDLQLLSPTTGWVATEAGVHLTTDTGQSWNEISPPNTDRKQLRSGHFLDTQRGWLVYETSHTVEGTEFTVYRTVDSGESWAPTKIAASADLTSPITIQFSDAAAGWLAATVQTSSNFSIGQLFYSADGGQSWTARSLPASGDLRPTNSTVAWMAGGPAREKLYVSRDRGNSWKPSAVSPPIEFRSSQPVFWAPRFLNNTSGILAVGYSGGRGGLSFYATSDSGARWRHSVTIESDSQNALGGHLIPDVVDEKTWFVADPNGSRIWKTTDGGASVEEISPNGLPRGIERLHYASATVAWVYATEGSCAQFKRECTSIHYLRRTTDAGQTWSDVIIT